MGDRAGHRKYSPSQAERLFACPGFARQVARAPQRTSRYAIEGTKAHTIVETALENGYDDAREAHDDSVHFFEDFDDEFLDAVQMMLDYVSEIGEGRGEATEWIETLVHPPVYPRECGGTLDYAMYDPKDRRLRIVDYKHGAGVAKEATTPQLKSYAAGVIFGDEIPVTFNDVDEVIVTIVQPRAFHRDGPIRERAYTPYEMYEYLEELQAAVSAAERPDAPLVAGRAQCQFCDAAVTCPAREAAALQVASDAFRQIGDVTAPQLPAPHDLDMERLGRIRFFAPLLRKWLSDVDDYCEDLARKGHVVPGAKLVRAQASRKWFGTDEEVAAKLAGLLDVTPDDIVQRKLPPILETEKRYVAKYKKDNKGKASQKALAEQAKKAFAFMTTKQSSGNLVLVDLDDERPAVGTKNPFAQISIASSEEAK